MTATWTAPRTWAAGELVTATMLNAHLRDNLEWLKGRPLGTEEDFDGTFFTTASATFQDTGANAAITTTGGRVLVVAFGTMKNSSSGTNEHLTIYEDGVNKGHATVGMQSAIQNNTDVPFALVYITPSAPTAALHEWKIYLRSSNGTSGVSITQYQMWAMEIGA